MLSGEIACIELNMAESETVRVNFLKPFPLFPLDSVALLPHALVRLYVFESRYRQMLEHVLDRCGQIALGVFEGEGDADGPDGGRAIRPVVCVGQIVRHEQAPGGNYHVWLRGICRAQVIEESPPEGDRLYRRVMLEPVRDECAPERLDVLRDRVVSLLGEDPLNSVEVCRRLSDQLRENADLAAPVVLELAALSLMGLTTDRELQHALLVECDAERRAQRIADELERINRSLNVVGRQFDPGAPQGVSWN